MLFLEICYHDTYYDFEPTLRKNFIFKIQVAQKICPHHVGHYLGLDIHDTPTIPSTKRFEAGVVFPLEPGIYFRDELAKLGVSRDFLGIGMRVEDDFVMSKTGCAENLEHVKDDLLLEEA
ncbi:unnamed protein product [Schistosoma mattheei]|uniref:Peptidase M24 domain-containing protein n=1 Tax=Schistosoma mattheei TaxID=31246 RepID=A0A3P8ENS8_9TREM|nr:unnamed protein product [Schistosoma mattheei]